MSLSTVWGVEASAGIEAQMSDDEKNKTGIAKLNEVELAALNAWLVGNRYENGTGEIADSRQCECSQEGREASFGLKQEASADAFLQIETAIAETREDPYGRYILKLGNDQVWRQNQSKRVQFKVGDKVIIKKGLFGSFDLKHEPSGLVIKVRRVK